MMILQNKTNQKIISFLIIVSTLTPIVLFSGPKQANAVALVCPPGKDLFAVQVHDRITSGSSTTTCLTTLKEWMQKTLEMARMAIAKRVLEKITQSTINWINSGFHGSPLFLENPESFFKDIAKSELRMMVDMFGYDRLRFPFGRDFALNAINAYKSTLQSNLSYSLSGVMSQQEAEAYRNDFSIGGWNGFFINTMYPQNNYIGFQMLANKELARRLEGTSQPPALEVRAQLQQGMGFLSPELCADEGTHYNDIMANAWNRPSFDYAGYESSHPMPPLTDEDATIAWSNAQMAAINEWSKTNECKNLVHTTPGSVVAHKIMMSLSSDVRSGELAMSMGNSLSMIFDALLNKLMGEGLNALAGAVSPQPPEDNWSYDGQTLDNNGNPPGPGTLVVPQNVSANVGQTTSTTISGGTAPYSVEIPPNTAIATATIFGATLTIAGIAPGETTVTVKDSSLPTKRATVRITIVGIGELMVVPANIVANINDQVVATVSGGTEPYIMSTGPDNTVAMAVFSDTILVVNGLASGQTSVVIKDSSFPVKTATVNITITDNQTENLTVTLTATPRIIRSGQSSTLTWSSTNATSCSSSWGLRTVPVNGNATVSPTTTTDYTVTCYGADGANTSDSATVSVNSL